MAAQVLPFSQFAKITRHERLRSGQRFGQMTGSQLSSIIRDLERGVCEDWGDFCQHMVRTDAHLQSVYSTRRDRVAGAKWVIEPAKVDSPDQQLLANQAAEFIDRQLRAVPTLEASFNRLLDGIGVGFAVSEIRWKPGLAGAELVELKWVHQRRLFFDGQYNLGLTRDASRTSGHRLPANKFVKHVPGELEGYPPLTGIFQSVAWYWLFKHWATEWWLQAVEQVGSPLMLGTVPSGTHPDVRDKFLAELQRMSADHAGVMEEGTSIDVNTAGAAAMSGDKTPQKSFSDSMDDAMSKAILGMTDATGSDVNGARAATDTRKGITIDPRMVKDGKKLWASLKRDLFPAMLGFNLHLFGGRMPPIPDGKFVHRDVEFEITPEIMTAQVATRNQIRRSGGLPALDGPEDDIPIVEIGKGAGLVGANGGVDMVADAQRVALSGQQVASLAGIVKDVASGLMPRDAAVAIVEASFPVDRLQADQLLGSAGVDFKPSATDDRPPAGPSSPAPPAGGQVPDVPFRRAQPRGTVTTSSRTSTGPTNPLATVLSGKSVDPASAQHRQLSIPFRR